MDECHGLIEAALVARGTAVAVIDAPTQGERARVFHANAVFCALFGVADAAMSGAMLDSLAGSAVEPVQWQVFLQALTRLEPMRLDLRLYHGTGEMWFSFDLNFAQTGSAYRAIIIGRDSTALHRQRHQDSETQRLLAAVFLKIDAAVTIVRGDGTIFMTNPAFQRLLGFTAEELVGLHIGQLTAREDAEAAIAARARQFADGKTYQMRLATVCKDGRKRRVVLTSALVRDTAGEGLRVVTLSPELATDGPVDAVGAPAQDIGQIQVIRLDALRAAFGPDWERVATRALLLAEQIIKRRMGKDDVFVRSPGDGFIIWFDDGDQPRNEARTAAMVREIRLRFLSELGDEVAGCVSAVTASIALEPGDLARLRAGEAPPAMLQASLAAREQATKMCRDWLRDLCATAPGELSLVVRRDGRPAGMGIADLSAEMRRRLTATEMMIPGEAAQRVDLDRLRLEIAMRAAGRLPAEAPSRTIVFFVSWAVIAEPERFRLWHAALGTLSERRRSLLLPVVTDLPPLLGGRRWAEMIAPQRTGLPGFGLALTAASAVTEAVREWKLALVFLDLTEAGDDDEEVMFQSVGRAAHRQLPILMRAEDEAGRVNAMEMGATLLVAESEPIPAMQ